MKKTNYMQKFLGLAALLMVLFACKPQMESGVDIGPAPTADQLSFTVTQGSTDFQFVLTNTSSIPGIVSWDLGNGSKSTKTSPTVTYSLPGTYTVTMTLITKGGTASTTQTVTQTKTDYSVFTDPTVIFLSGGISETNGKTWAIDSLARGHLSVGPVGTDGTSWWMANPLEKSAAKVLYDDRLTFKLEGFKAIYVNHGQSFVKSPRATDPAYSNAYSSTGDWVVTYPNPQPGTWSVETRGDKKILKLTGPTPIYPCYDAGAQNGEYEIVSIDENFLDLLCTDVEGNAWRTKLIRAGYVKPKVTFDVSVEPTSNVNEYAVKLTNVVIPAELSITSFKVDFGDGTVKETADYNSTLKNTYMRKSPYTITITVTTSNETLTSTKSIEVTANHPDYVPFLLDMMVMYNDFSEVMEEPVLGQDCSVTIVDNPSKVYPDKSAKVAFFSKTNQQWANAYMQLPAGYRFDLRDQHTFKIMVYGKAGQQVLMKLENTDRAGNAWQTGTADLIYTIKKDDTWEVAEYNFAGVSAGWDWTGDIFTSDITTDSRFNHDFYNVVRIMLNPGVGDGTHEFYFDELAGPHVEGLKSALIK